MAIEPLKVRSLAFISKVLEEPRCAWLGLFIETSLSVAQMECYGNLFHLVIDESFLSFDKVVLELSLGYIKDLMGSIIAQDILNMI